MAAHGPALLVPGGSGQLGRELAALADDELEVHAPGHGELDITCAGSAVREVDELARRAQRAGRFPVVINTAAYTAVDDAESDESAAFAVNVDGPRVLAAACSSRRVPLVHISTDYVFAGDRDRPYEPDDVPAPRSAYGRTKAAGEHAVLSSGATAWIVRTSWVYGRWGENFVRTMARLERERDTVSAVEDQHSCPTWTADLATGLVELARRIAAGDGPTRDILHCVGGGEATRYSFTRAIFTELGADPDRVRPCRSEDFPRPAPRPEYSVLSQDAWAEVGLTPLRPWEQALAAFIKRHGETLRAAD